MLTIEIIEEARRLIKKAGSNVKQSIQLLIKNAENLDDRDLLESLETQFSELERKSRLGILSFSEENLQRNKIVSTLLSFLSQKGKELSERLVILFFGAVPNDLPHLDIEDEKNLIEMKMVKHEHYDFVPIMNTTVEKFQDALIEYNPRFIHFACHSNANGLFFENKDGSGNREFFNAEKLRDAVRKRSRTIDCVFLNSCESEGIANLIDFTPYVIAMNAEVHDMASNKFSQAMYSAISKENSKIINYLDAFTIGKERLEQLSLSDSFTVEFFKNTLS